MLFETILWIVEEQIVSIKKMAGVESLPAISKRALMARAHKRIKTKQRKEKTLKKMDCNLSVK